MSRIFVIGLNKCGTTALHQMFRRSGLASLHYRAAGVGIAAIRLVNNHALGLPLLTGMDGFVAYSDLSFADRRLCIEGARHFRQLHAEHPDAHFVLNTRDEDGWLASRLAHLDGTLAARAMAAHKVDTNGLRRLWSGLWRTHHAEVRAHLAGNPRFVEFHIERDDPAMLADRLGPAHRIDPRHWAPRNVTRRRAGRER